MISHDRLLRILSYDRETGDFVWKQKIADKVVVGNLAGSINYAGYRIIKIEGEKYMAHRLAWFYVTKNWPKEQIDHADGVRLNNRLRNLREASPAQNGANRKVNEYKVIGYKGVRQVGKNKWQARIKFMGRTKHLGMFSSINDAAAAYERAAKEHFGEFARVA